MSSPLPPPRKKQKTTPSCDQDGKDDPLLAPAFLTTELIARVASFAPYGTDAMNICLAVGPTDSAIIRHTCLRNNMKYMAHRLEQYVDEEVGNDQVTTYALAWMAVNTDWRKLCTADNRKRYANVLIERENKFGWRRDECSINNELGGWKKKSASAFSLRRPTNSSRLRTT